MSSTTSDKHRKALVKGLIKWCEKHKSTCPNARNYLDMLTTETYTDDNLNEINDQFACPCEICDGPHYTVDCFSHQDETQCDECGTVCKNSQALHEHLDQWGNCPYSVECEICEERHYTSECPWCKTCAFRREKCNCNDVPSPSLSSPTAPTTTAPTTTAPTTTAPTTRLES